MNYKCQFCSEKIPTDTFKGKTLFVTHSDDGILNIWDVKVNTDPVLTIIGAKVLLNDMIKITGLLSCGKENYIRVEVYLNPIV